MWLPAPRRKSRPATGDTITHVNGKPVKSGDELVASSQHQARNKVDLTYVRNGQQKEANVTVLTVTSSLPAASTS